MTVTVTVMAKGRAGRRMLRAGAAYVLGVIPYARYQRAPGASP